MYMKKYRIWICLCLVIMFAMVGCGKKENVQETVSMFDLRTKMLEAGTNLPEMLSVSDSDADPEKLLSYVSDLPYEKVDRFFISYSAEGKADEIVVLAVKDIADVDLAKQSLEQHQQERLKLLREYEPKEVQRLEQALFFVKEQYAIMIVCEQKEDIKTAFEKFLEDNGGEK